MSIKTQGYAAKQAGVPLAPYTFERREPAPNDVLIDIDFCGVCHSDIHQTRGEWGGGTFPMVPGHEIIGRVSRVGAQVSKFKAGDRVGVGCFVDSCRECAACKQGEESYCSGDLISTYNGREKDGKTIAQGGYSKHITVTEDFVLRIPDGLDSAAAAPLLCAGITTYSPLKHWKVGPGHQVAVVGLGGLGHMGVKLAAAMGAEVTVISHSDKKRDDARRLGAKHFISSKDAGAMSRAESSFDFILDTVSAEHDLNAYLGLLKFNGTMVVVGVPPKPASVHHFSLIPNRRSLAGSLVGGIRETQEMLDFCAAKNVASDIEMIAIKDINEAYERMIQGDVKYRFVIDLTSLK